MPIVLLLILGNMITLPQFLKKLHWMPVRFRMSYKILLITYKIIFDEAPEYLSELISVKKSSRTLRSSIQTMLHVPASRLKTVGDCAFNVASPTLWNILPVQIKNANSLGKPISFRLHMSHTTFVHTCV